MALLDVSKLIESVQVDSAYGPPITIAEPLRQRPASPNDPGSFLKPKVTLKIQGLNPIVIAPYGEPGATKWNAVVGGSTLIFGLALYGLWRLIR